MMSSLLVAAIDFGTTYSGWAFSFRHNFEKDPTNVFAKNWKGNHLMSSKAPTCILIKPDGKTFDSFGYDAETKYAELAAEADHEKWFFFRRFKMMLFDKMSIGRTILLDDESGKTLPARTVFSLSIKFLKNDLLKECNNQIGDGIEEKDIRWVLTVPAIWNDAAKQFMREAAEKTGIQRNNLSIALEPEAASLFCRHLPIRKGDNWSLAAMKPGTKYIVLDAGGGTIDVTVHQVIVDDKLKELHRANGGAWGGTQVDKAYEQFIADLVGTEVITGSEVLTTFKAQHMEDYLDLLRYFEIKKRAISSNSDAKVTFQIPQSLASLVQEKTKRTLNECILSSPLREDITHVHGKLRVDAGIVRKFFYDSINRTVNLISSLLKDKAVRDCAAILMVGGFSESPLLQEAVRTRFSRMKIIIPEAAGLAVLKGAVIFGHCPTTIAERICRYTYGESSNHVSSLDCNHLPTETETWSDGEIRCINLFMKHVTIGQMMKLGEEQKESVKHPHKADQRSVIFKMYASTSPDPVLITEPGCTKIGEVKISIPDTSLGRNRLFGVRYIFGRTEVVVKIEDKATGKVHIEAVDFLEGNN